MIRCIKFEKFLDNGSTKPFLANCGRGESWVVKAYFQANDSTAFILKSIFNEFISGAIANIIDLPWPKVDIIQLDSQIFEQLEKVKFDILSELAVGIEYINELQIYNPSKEELSNTTESIRELFPQLEMQNSFYGKSVFDNLVKFQDTKYNTLAIKPDGSPIFIDGSMAFDGHDWNLQKLKWQYIHLEYSPYLKGIVSDYRMFDYWLRKIEEIPDLKIHEIFNKIPTEWPIPKKYKLKLKKLLLSAKVNFIPLFKEEIEIALHNLSLKHDG